MVKRMRPVEGPIVLVRAQDLGSSLAEIGFAIILVALFAGFFAFLLVR